MLRYAEKRSSLEPESVRQRVKHSKAQAIAKIRGVDSIKL
jgi:hypothetical protein